MTSLNEYQRKANQKANVALTSEQMRQHALLGMSSAVGMVCTEYADTYDGHVVDKGSVKVELGCLLWYIAELCMVNGFELEEVCRYEPETNRAES